MNENGQLQSNVDNNCSFIWCTSSVNCILLPLFFLIEYTWWMCVCLPVAVVALEWLRSGVFAVVSCQLITSGKTPFAAFPWALIGLLTWEAEKETEEKVSYFIIMPTCNFPRLNLQLFTNIQIYTFDFYKYMHTPYLHAEPRGRAGRPVMTQQPFQSANTLN